VTSITRPASQGKPKLGETNGDRQYLMQVLRAATARAKLIANTLDTIGIALRQKAVSVEDAMLWARDEGIMEARKSRWQIAGVSNGPVGICVEHRDPAANFARATALAAD
jgi:hypothetical protein